jgi:rubredoxin
MGVGSGPGHARHFGVDAFKTWQCGTCGFIYDEAEGLPDEGLPPGTRWSDIPESWNCPECGMAKSQFDMVEV